MAKTKATTDKPQQLKCQAVVGKDAPDFTLPDDNGNEVTLSSLKGKNIVLYFYPKDNTSGCTLEAVNFQKNLEKFANAGFDIIGISRDSVKSHAGFKTKQGLTFTLLSDADSKVCNLYGVLKLKKLYGREYMGIERSTFIIDEKGVLVAEYRGVSPKDHIDKLIEDLKLTS